MSTYALVTKAGAADVTGAVRAGRVGGYVAPDLLGTIVLFDPPDRTSATTRRLLRPAAELVKRTGVPAWLLLGDEEMSEAVMISAAGPHHLSWVAGWDPPADPTEYLAHRQSWDAHCAEVATAYGAPHRATELSMVRNDPIPGEPPAPLGDLLRRVCAVFGLPDVAVGRSLLDSAEPGLFDAHRVDVAPPSGVWQRLFART
ncbi:hypothetical protein [Paractinoplanes rishiriensis]|nr:hypothetical protein [Actinoplanes rishiriensis]